MFVKFLLQFSPFFLNELGQGHVHLFENNIKFAVFILYPLSLHDIRTVLAAILINIIEPLQNLYFSLIKGLLFCLEFIFKALYSIIFASMNMSTLINMAETATTDEFLLLKFIPKNSLPFWRRTHGGTLLMSQLHCVSRLETHRCALMLHKLL